VGCAIDANRRKTPSFRGAHRVRSSPESLIYGPIESFCSKTLLNRRFRKPLHLDVHIVEANRGTSIPLVIVGWNESLQEAPSLGFVGLRKGAGAPPREA
jgi:hypothetical protein